MSIKTVNAKHKIISENEKINAVRGAIFPDATSKSDLITFSLSSSRSKN